MSTGTKGLEDIAQTILAFDELLDLIRTKLPLATPWQRSLASRLAAADTQMQVLRMTIAMVRGDAEIQAAASALHVTCRSLVGSLNGTRADGVLRGALQMLADHAQVLQQGLAGNLTMAELGRDDPAG